MIIFWLLIFFGAFCGLFSGHHTTYSQSHADFDWCDDEALMHHAIEECNKDIH